MNKKEKTFVNELLLSISTNALTSTIFFALGLLINFAFALNIPIAYLVIIGLFVSAIVSGSLILNTYRGIFDRLSYLGFLREDSATKSFEMFVEITKDLIIKSGINESSQFESLVRPKIGALIAKRRQPMQIIDVDCQKIIERAEQYKSQTSVAEQILYYLDFMTAYKRMAMPRIIRQVSLYMETFGEDGITDYVVIYGHSTVVVNSVISGYRINPFPIIVVEDLQYHRHSLGEHKTVCMKLKKANVPYTLIKFDGIQKLFDTTVTSLPNLSGENLPLLRKRRMHAFIGCERVDTHGNTLVPSESRGIPSETAQFLQEIEAYSKERGTDKATPARVTVLGESYKIRTFGKNRDIQTHIPLRGKTIQSIFYVLGIRKQLPDLYPVSLFNIDSNNIYAHINELGIFPNVAGRFDLRYCENVFETETSLLGFFSRPLFLKYKIFDEMKAVLFDLNGVIVDDEDVHFAAFVKVVDEFGVAFTKKDYEELCYGRSDIDGFKQICSRFNLECNLDQLVQKKHSAYLISIALVNLQMFQGVERLLRELRNRGYRIGLVTASNREEVEAILGYLKIAPYFDVVITNDDVSESKPSPQGYLVASEKLGVSPMRCLVIEDSPANITNVMKIGMRTIGIQKSGKFIDNANFAINSIEDLLVA